MSEYLQVADYFVVVTGLSRPHVKAIHQELHVRLKKLGEFHREPEGADMAWWVILDYDAVVVHALQAEAREWETSSPAFDPSERHTVKDLFGE